MKLTTIPLKPDLLERYGPMLLPDRELGLPGCSGTNRQLRLFVAASMIGEELTPAQALETARELYYWSNIPIDKPGPLTQVDIEREVWKLVDIHNAVDG